MTWAVVLGNRAEKNLKRLPTPDRARILSALEGMRHDPLVGDVVKLKGQEAFRRRVGNSRSRP